MARKTDNKREASCRAAGAARRPSNRRVYLGFWTAAENKKELREIARLNKRSVSSCIDEIVEQYLFKGRIIRYYKAERIPR